MRSVHNDFSFNADIPDQHIGYKSTQTTLPVFMKTVCEIYEYTYVQYVRDSMGVNSHSTMFTNLLAYNEYSNGYSNYSASVFHQESCSREESCVECNNFKMIQEFRTFFGQ